MVMRFIVCLMLLPGMLISVPAGAAVSAQLSAQSIDELETVRLTIRVTDSRQSQTLDLTALETDFHVMNSSTASRSQFINGRGNSWVDYQITLQPKHTGTLTISSIAVGSERTPTLKLQVHPLSTQTRQVIDELVFFESEVSSNRIYVQSQLILIRRLLYSQGVQLYSDLPGAPEIADAVVLSIGETSSGNTQRKGKTYGVVEQRYAIFPEASGTFTLPGVSITASVRLLEGDRVSRKGVRVGTEPKHITVLPVPANYPEDQPWLPAQNVQLYDVISPEHSTHQVGDTLTHELLIDIEGNIGSISPPLPLLLNDEEFRIYAQEPVIQDDASATTVKGSRLQTNAIVPLRPGLLRLPVTQLVWWDTVNEEVRLSKTKLLSLDITGQPLSQVRDPSQDSLPSSQQDPAQDAVKQETADKLNSDSAEAVMLFGFSQPHLWRYLTIISGLLGVIICIFVFRHAGKFWRQSGPGHAHAKHQLQQAFTSLDDKRIHTALTVYLSELYGCPRHIALAHFSAVSDDAAAALKQLEHRLYAADNENAAGDFAANLKQLQTAITKLESLSTKHSEAIKQTENVLPRLYPQSS